VARPLPVTAKLGAARAPPDSSRSGAARALPDSARVGVARAGRQPAGHRSKRRHCVQGPAPEEMRTSNLCKT
jgi:hypothetical protein